MGGSLPDGCTPRQMWDALDPEDTPDSSCLEDDGYDEMREREWEQERSGEVDGRA